jgi:hypothetical protein
LAVAGALLEFSNASKVKEEEKDVTPQTYWIILRRVFVVVLTTGGADIRLGGVSFIPNHRRSTLDAAAGCEYVDDRIRFNE